MQIHRKCDYGPQEKQEKWFIFTPLVCLGMGWLAGHEIRGCPPSQTEKHTFATSGKMDHSHESLSCNGSLRSKNSINMT